MSNSEHLIENAIVCLRDNKPLDYFKNECKSNREMVEIDYPDSDIDTILDNIWDMANHVCYTWFYNETFKEQIS